MDSLANDTQANMSIRTRSRISALSCIKILIILDLLIRSIKISSISVVLYIKRNEEVKVPLKLFLAVYLVITIARTITFISKNRTFFNIQRIPEFRDNPDLALFSNFVEALLLFWYLIGFHWLQDCTNCQVTNPLLYYMSATWVITYKGPEDLPDETMNCTICFEQYEIGNSIKFLPCDHHFHCDCVDEWLNLKDTCPLCKKNINMLYDLVDPPEHEI
ncbi:hypothetical protein P3W45_000013 [Vairimorpha bombi]